MEINEIIKYFSILKIVEIVGLLTGLIYVIGAILEKKWCWYFGIIAVITYGISTYYYKLYGEFALQFFYLGISFYGLRQWSKPENDELHLSENLKKDLKISYSNFQFLSINILIGILLSIAIYFVLVYFNSTFPVWDALTTGFGIIATYLTTKKKIENWILWIIIDVILSYVLFLKGLPFYSALYFFYLGFAVLGFYQWKKEIKL